MKYLYYFGLLLLVSACKKPEDQKLSDSAITPTFKNILILGNSITHHKPAPEVGWNSDWGMAASARDRDYVHLLTSNFRKIQRRAKVSFFNVADYENAYWVYELAALDTMVKVKQDLIILRFAENVNSTYVVDNNFKKHYLRLIEHLKKSHPNAKIICTSGFWENPKVGSIIEECATETKSIFVSLSQLDKPEYMAWGKFAHTGVAAHPGDTGMKAIADLIWTEVEQLLIPNP